MRVRKGIVLAAAGGFVAMPALAQSGWRGIGRAQADPGAASVTITVARGDPRYREMMVCVEGQAIRLPDAILHYQDGRVQTMQIRARIADGGCSRMSDRAAATG